jgi:type III restriction enzyme
MIAGPAHSWRRTAMTARLGSPDDHRRAVPPSALSLKPPQETNLAKHLLYSNFRDDEGFPKQHLFPQIQRLARRWLDEGYLVTKGVPVGAILYQDQLVRAAAKIDIALTRGSEGRILAVLDPYNPKGSTRFVNFITSKTCWVTGARPPKCHISHVVLDSSWEEQLALTLENHPRVLAYAKNQAPGFDIPYLDAGVMRRYLPDFIVRLDDGGDEPLNLILEVKGARDESDKAKAETTRDLWVKGVNALGGFGRWDFRESRDWTVMEDDFAAFVDRLVKKVAA